MKLLQYNKDTKRMIKNISSADGTLAHDDYQYKGVKLKLIHFIY